MAATEAETVANSADEEMGEAEYLEDDTADDDGDGTEVEGEAADKSNADNVQNEKEVATKGAEAAAEAEAGEENQKEDSNTATAEVEDADDEGGDAEDEDEEGEEEEEDVEEEEEEEGELIIGDDPKPAVIAAGGANEEETEPNVTARSGAQKQEEQVDENQCRVCTSKEELVSLFTKTSEATTPADMLLLLCPSVSIAPKDFMPQFICSTCQQSLTIAIKLRKQLETTERDLRKRLSRSKNKVRRPRGYVVIDAPVSDSASEEDEEELNDDAEFKVSDVAGSTSADSESADSDISEKRKPGRPGRRGRKKGTKRSATGSQNEDEYYSSSSKKKSSSGTPAAAAQGPFECDHCDLSFPRKQSYVMHRKTHEARYEFHCQICNKKFKVRGAYKTHMERHEAERAQFRCELCSQVFRLRAELKRHMAVRHDEHGVIYECKRCQRTFLTQTRLQRHQSTNCVRHPEPKQVKQRQSMESGHPSQGRDLFKSVAPLTTTYWSDSFSD